MRSGANAGGRDDYHPTMDDIDRQHCRLDLDKVEGGTMTAAEFVAKWRDALRAYLIR